MGITPTSKAVSSRAKGGYAFLLEGLDDVVESRAGLVGAVVDEPLHDVKALGSVDGNGIVVDDVGYDGQVAIGGILVGEQLVVRELVAEDVGHEQDSDVLVDIAGGTCDISSHCDYQQMGRSGGKRLAAIPPFSVSSLPVGSPWCLTPTVQHFPGGFEAIVKGQGLQLTFAVGRDISHYGRRNNGRDVSRAEQRL